MDCVSCRPVPLLGSPRPQEPRTASEKVKLCKFMVLRWRDWGARTRASALVPRNFVALPPRVLLIYCDSAFSSGEMPTYDCPMKQKSLRRCEFSAVYRQAKTLVLFYIAPAAKRS